MPSIDSSLKALDAVIQKGHSSPAVPAEILHRILTQPRVMPRQSVRTHLPRRKLFLVAIAGTAAAVATGVLGAEFLAPAPEPAFAATPRLLRVSAISNANAAQVLEEIAHRTESMRDGVPADGSVRLVQETWSLTTRIGGVQVTSAVVPERREVTPNADGSFEWSIRVQKPQIQDDAQREAWGAQWDAVREPVDRSGTSRSPFGEPPSDLAGMQRWLEVGAPADTGGFISESVVDKLRDHHLRPRQRAALLRVLKARPGLTCAGTVTDRAGRRGIAFTIESDDGGLPSRHMLIVDPEMGKILAYEEILKSAGALKVKVPAVVNYVNFLVG
ncbi:CU044_5270 family protein [Streptomyces sp. NPDC002073]